LEEAKLSREEEGASRIVGEARRMAEEDRGAWVDESDDKDNKEEEASIGERIWTRGRRTQAMRTLPGEGGHMQ
jgi:hypothetical protein